MWLAGASVDLIPANTEPVLSTLCPGRARFILFISEMASPPRALQALSHLASLRAPCHQGSLKQ